MGDVASVSTIRHPLCFRFPPSRDRQNPGAAGDASVWKKPYPTPLGTALAREGLQQIASGPNRKRPGTFFFLGSLSHSACPRRCGVRLFPYRWLSPPRPPPPRCPRLPLHSGCRRLPVTSLRLLLGPLPMLPYPLLLLLQTLLWAPTESSSTQLALKHYAAASALSILWHSWTVVHRSALVCTTIPGEARAKRACSGSAPGRPESPRAARRASGPLPDGPRRPPERSRTDPGLPDRSKTASGGPEDGPKRSKRVSETPKMASRRPQRPPRGPKSAPSAPPRGAPEAKIVDFHLFFRCFLPSRFFGFPTLQEGPGGPQESPKTAQEAPKGAP